MLVNFEDKITALRIFLNTHSFPFMQDLKEIDP